MSTASAPIRVALAGSTGSIGRQALEVIRAEPGRYQVVALAASRSVDEVLRQIAEFDPAVVAISNDAARASIIERLAETGRSPVITDELAAVVEPADVVINAVVGFAGLAVTVGTLAAGRRLGLANKESLIAAGPVVQPLRATPGAELIPVDSEHCAIHQCLRSSIDPAIEVARLILTASGGPFRGRTADELEQVEVADALAHPTWSMGPKITVDSSTLMNKGLEVIEAHELFGIDYDHIDVVVHPQSVVHSMVEFGDGSTIAQLSLPDMRLPIGYALGWPQRITTPFGRIDWGSLGRLDFEVPDQATFACLGLAYQAGRAGGTAPAWLSAANEIAVEAFLGGRIRWNQIADVCDSTLQRHDGVMPTNLEQVIDADLAARRQATASLEAMAR